jgi:hypothetical protein
MPKFFSCDRVMHKEAANRAVGEAMVPLRQRRAEFLDGRVRRRPDEIEDHRHLRFDPPEATVTAMRLWPSARPKRAPCSATGS